MRYGKSMLILMLAVFLLAVASASAGDVNDTAMASEDANQIDSSSIGEITDDDAILAKTNDEIASAGTDSQILAAGEGNYSDLRCDIENGGNLTKSHYIYHEGDGPTIEITSPSMIVNGNGAVIDMAGSNMRAFYVSAFNVTIKNLTIKNAKYSGDAGGAVYFNSSGSLINCNFADNSASDGGAVCLMGNGTVTNCNFVNNSAYSEGGAVYLMGNGTVENCNFDDNKVAIGGGEGGAINIASGTVSNCNFTNNKVTLDYSSGGAIWIGWGSVENCNFAENYASSEGGAIKMLFGCVTNCNFTDNFADDGGAIYFGGNGTVTNCNFADNSAKWGGAILWDGEYEAIEWYCDGGCVSGCVFVNNSATHGGAIEWCCDGGCVSGCVFVNNSAGESIIYFDNWQADNLTINNNVFLNNNATEIAFEENDSTSNADYNWFGNNATDYGVAPKTGNVEINNWLYLNATATPGSLSESSQVTFKLYLCNSTGTFDYDNAKLPGVNLTLSAANGNISKNATKLGEPVTYALTGTKNGSVTAKVENVVQTVEIRKKGDFDLLQDLINNAASSVINLERNYTFNEFDTITEGIVINRNVTINGNGHVIDAKGKSRVFNVEADDVTIENLTIKNANSNGEGGAICFKGIGTVENCNFANNSAWAGGAINFEGIGTVENCNFTNNSATNLGGAIRVFRNGTVTNSNFADNKATGEGSEGGAIEMSCGTVSYCNFTNNKASYEAGAIWIGLGSVDNCNFADNYAPDFGGAIKTGFCCVTNCNFMNNSADYGGAIFWDDGGSGCVSGCVFMNNTDGWTIIHFNNEHNDNLTINNNVFLNNNVTEIAFYQNDSASNADYNWFGNNATDYDVAPKIGNVKINNWLYLNATADPGSLSESSQVTFKLYLCNSTGTFDYDNAKLPGVNLTLSAANGNISKNATKLGEPVTYTLTGTKKGSVTANVENVVQTVEIRKKGDFDLLQDLINNAASSVINLERNYTFNEFDTITEGIVINRNVTINGNGHVIDAKGKSRVFIVNANNVSIKNVTFINGNTTEGGGAIYWNSTNGNVSGCVFVNNSAYDGGAIYWGGSDGSVSGCVFVNNSATHGGAIYWGGSDGSVSGCVFVNNSATHGGAIAGYVFAGNVSGCVFVNNSAADGGAIAGYWFNGNVFGCVFVNNSAAEEGGAIKLTWFNGNVSGCVFVNNSAGGDAGTMYVFGWDSCVSHCVFVNNSAAMSIIYFVNDYMDNLTINNNIFLNNNATEIAFYQKGSISNVDCNWFGNNATDYDVAPKMINVEINNWLYLNATADPGSISISESSQILFKLYLYNSTGTFDYDNAKLPGVNLTLTATNGNVSGTVRLGENATFTATGGGTGSVTASLENVKCTVKIDIGEDPELAVGSQDAYYSQDTVIALSYNSTATGKVNITLKGKKFNYTFTDMDLNSTLSLGRIHPDEYNVTVAYSGDATFSKATAKGNLTVTPIVDVSVTITTDKDEYFVGDIVVWTLTVCNAGNGTDATEVYVDNNFPGDDFEMINATTGNGTYYKHIGNEYWWEIGFMANGTDATLKIVSRAKAARDDIYNFANGFAKEYDWNLTNNLAQKDVTVKKINSTINVTGTALDYGRTANITVAATGATGITAEINGTNLTVSGFTVEIPVLDAGTYTLTVITVPDENHTAANASATVEVNKVNSTLTVDDVEFVYGDAGYATVSFDGATGVTAAVVEEGIIIIDIENSTFMLPSLDAGTYTLRVSTIPDDNHDSLTRDAKITVKRIKTELNASDVTATYNVNKDLVISLRDANGNPVGSATLTVGLNGDKNYTTDENGSVNVSTKGLAPGAYAANITFAGDANHEGSSINANVTVKKAAAKITAKAKTFKTTTKTKKFTVTLKNNIGKPIKKATVYLKVGGKTYKATTNSKGKATFKITKLTKKGTYKATVTFKANKYYKKATKKVKITVKAGFKTVSKGSKDSKMVKKIQRALKNNGYYLSAYGHYLKIDGVYHGHTEAAVKQFQKDKGLKVTGKVDEKTAKKLKII